MDNISKYLEKKKTSNAKTARQELLERVTLFLHFPATAQFLQGIPDGTIERLLQYAKKEGEQPKSFFKYLIQQEKKK
jgi:hypothetical protein